MDGSMYTIPRSYGADLNRFIHVYGLHPGYVRGKLTRKFAPRKRVDPMIRSHDKQEGM
jgi:hypothetical protein